MSHYRKDKIFHNKQKQQLGKQRFERVSAFCLRAMGALYRVKVPNTPRQRGSI